MLKCTKKRKTYGLNETSSMTIDKIRIAYGLKPSQFGDLRVPVATGKQRPVMIVIHGGFWYAEYGLDLMDDISDDLTTRGYATWNIEYRRIGQEGGAWPGTLQDIGQAADFLRELAEPYQLDLNRILVIGHSAGGHLALWLAARHKLAVGSDLLSASQPLTIHGVISLAGVSDLQFMWEIRQVNSPVVAFLGGTPDEVPDRYALASPAELLPIGVPQVLIHGTEDKHVPSVVSDRYYDAAVECGDSIALVELPGIDHFAVIRPTSDAWVTIMLSVAELFARI